MAEVRYSLREVQPFLNYGDGGVVNGVNVHQVHLANWRQNGRSMRQVVFALSALERLYYPAVIGQFQGWEEELKEVNRWRKRLAVRAMLDWIDVDADR